MPKDADEVGGGGAVAKTFGLDHKNLRHRWRSNVDTSAEARRKAIARQLKQNGGGYVRPFPEGKKEHPGGREHVEIAWAESGGAAQAALAAAQAQQGKSILQDKGFLKIDQSKLPLHIYDDEELFETRSPEQWLESGSSATSPYFLGADVGWQWRPCAVLGFERGPQEVRYQIRFYESEGVNSAAKKLVRRTNLQFDLEEPSLFTARIAACEQRREDTKAQLRYDYHVSSQPTDSRQKLKHF